MQRNSAQRRAIRHLRIRKRVVGTATRPRFCISITANNIYCQFIDDEAGATLVAVSTLSAEFKALELKRDVAASAALGKLAASKAIEKGISEVVFDRGGFKYHGRVKALADAAREAGLKF